MTSAELACTSRVSALAGANEVLVSSTLRDLVIGSGLEFEERGAYELKGVPANGTYPPSPLHNGGFRLELNSLAVCVCACGGTELPRQHFTHLGDPAARLS